MGRGGKERRVADGCKSGCLGPYITMHPQAFISTALTGDEGEVDVGGCGGRQLALGLLRCLPEPLHGDLVVGEVDARLTLELRDLGGASREE